MPERRILPLVCCFAIAISLSACDKGADGAKGTTPPDTTTVQAEVGSTPAVVDVATYRLNGSSEKSLAASKIAAAAAITDEKERVQFEQAYQAVGLQVMADAVKNLGTQGADNNLENAIRKRLDGKTVAEVIEMAKNPDKAGLKPAPANRSFIP